MRSTTLKWVLGAFAAFSTAMAHAEPVTIGFIYPTPVADVGWAKQLDLGREAVEKAYGDRVATRVVENIPEGPDAARVMNQLVTDGAKFVMIGSFGYMNDGMRLARQSPGSRSCTPADSSRPRISGPLPPVTTRASISADWRPE